MWKGVDLLMQAQHEAGRVGSRHVAGKWCPCSCVGTRDRRPRDWGFRAQKGVFSQFWKADLGCCCGRGWFWPEASVLA